MTKTRARRRIVAGFAALTVWVVGSALGAPPGSPGATAAPLIKIGKAHPASFMPSLNGKKPIFILVLGSDARPGQPVDRERSDSIHLVGINPRKKAASILGFPRDAWVTFPGGGQNKINNAMSAGGPELTVETVEELTGIRIDYYMLTSFEGFKKMIDGVGGVVVDVPYAMSDVFSKVDLEEGKQRLSGGQALAFSRNRHDVPNGDFSRSENQGILMQGALETFRKEFRRDPSRLLTWIGAGLRNIETDLSLEEVLDLAFTAAAVDASKVTNDVVPGTIDTIGDQSVVVITGAADEIYADMKPDGLIG